ncbi:ribonuclease H-like domain-containing protein [Tanacetum coccineum]
MPDPPLNQHHVSLTFGLNGSAPASNKGDAPTKPPQIITTNTLSTLNCRLQKDDYDTWAMEMEHYLEYIDNEVWKVIQNGNSKKRVTKGKDGVYRVLPPTTQEEQFADEKERKARTLLLMAVPKDHLRRFHGMDDAKEIWAAIKTRFGGNANSKKMQKAVLKQQFEAFTISSKESLEKGYDRYQKLLSQLDALGAGVSDEDANHKFLRSLPPAWDSLAMTMRTKKNIDTLSIDDLYNNLSVFEQDIQKTSSSSLSSDNVAFLSQAKAKASSSKNKPSQSSGSYSSYTTSSSKATPTATPGLADEVIHSFLATNADDVDLIHEDLDQIDDLDLEEMDINWQIAMTAIKIKKFYKKTGRRPRVDGKMHVAFDKRKVECFNCHNTGHFARECKFKGSKEGSRQEAGRGQDFKPVRTEKEALMTIDEGQINWVEQTTDEELNHALMAFTVNNEEDIDDSLYEYGKFGPQPQSPSPTESDASSKKLFTQRSNPMTVHKCRPQPVEGPGPKEKLISLFDWPILKNYQELKSKVESYYFGGSNRLVSVEKICDKKLNVLFTEKECFVVSSDFKMPDENQVLLKVPRQHNMYTFDMKNVASSKGYTCLLAKASSDEAKLWHRRLGHLNFKNLNKLVKGNLVRGLPSKSFKNDHTCVACQKGKQHKASCKAKIDRQVTHPLHTLHMDLFGPTSVRSINHASYCLVITDDCSRTVTEALEDESWVEAMQEELLQFKLQQVWVLVDLPNGAKIEAIRLFLAFASFMGFIVYQMDVKSAFLYDTIDEEVYVSQPPGFVDPDHPTKKISFYGSPTSLGVMSLKLKMQTDSNEFKGNLNIFSSLSITPWRPSTFDKRIRKLLNGDVHRTDQCIEDLQVSQGKPTCGCMYPRESPFDLEAFSIVTMGFPYLDRKSTTVVVNFLVKKTYLMAKYCDKHNQVGFLRKPDESTGFAEIVDFLRGSNLRYALTANPTIYDSLVKQFWQSAITTSNTDGSLEISATIDTIRYTISEASIRDSLQLDDATGITMLPNADLFLNV